MAKILVVDDSAVDRHLLKAILSRNPSWQLQFAEDGQQAVELLQRSANSQHDENVEPDLIITDLQMPELDGLQLVQFVREQFWHIPVILVTSQGSEEIAVQALRQGAASFAPKSSLDADLMPTIEQVLNLVAHMKFDRDLKIHPPAKSVAFVLENEMSFIGPTIEHLQQNLPKWSDRDRLQIGMALDEAITNAMQHGNLEVDSCLRESEEEDRYYQLIAERKSSSPYCHRRVRIEAEFSEQHLCVQISDDGQGFDPSTVIDPTDDENLHRVSGRGLFLINSFMDAVSHNGRGNQITMIKFRQDETDES